jgi:hypothetical protein
MANKLTRRLLMNLSDNDLELFLQIFDKALAHIPDKNKEKFAEDYIFTLDDYGVDLKRHAVEIGDHDELLDQALTDYFEVNDDHDSDEEYAEEYWEED